MPWGGTPFSVRPVVTAHGGKFNIRVAAGHPGWSRMTQGDGPGQFEIGPIGVTVYGKGEVWTLVPWANVLLIEPTT